jgi:hypothetical protein
VPVTAFGRRQLRIQFCAFSARRRFHTVWTRSGEATTKECGFQSFLRVSYRDRDHPHSEGYLLFIDQDDANGAQFSHQAPLPVLAQSRLRLRLD